MDVRRWRPGVGRSRWRRTGATALLALACGAAGAQHRDDRYWLHVAAYWPNIASYASADWLATGRPGTVIDFESELGLADRKALPWFQLGARLGEHWRVELEYFALNRSGQRTITRDLVWDDTVFPANASVASTFDSDILRLSAGWSFVYTERLEVGAVLGLHVTRFRIALQAEVAAEALAAETRVETDDALLPLPTIGLYGKYDVTRSWSVFGHVDYFSLTTGSYEGGLVNAMAGVGWRINDRFGLQLGYRYVDYSLGVNRSDWRGSVDYRFSGPYLSFQLGF
jgi:hypothetical protein